MYKKFLLTTFILNYILLNTIFGQQCFDCGDGSMGVFHAIHDTDLTGGNYNFSTFKIDAGVVVHAIGNQPLIIHCNNDIEINGELTASGKKGTNGIIGMSGGTGGKSVAGGRGGANGTFSVTGYVAGKDGNGLGHGYAGNNWNGGGGAGYSTNGSSSGGSSGKGGISYGNIELTNYIGGSGGASGSAGNNCGSGGGGGGGGVIALFTCKNIYINSGAIISSNGGNGGSDGNGNCGGGGGGSGGSIWIAGDYIYINGIVTAIGGNGGTSGVAGYPKYGEGGKGADGRIRIDHNQYDITGTISPSSGFTSHPYIVKIIRSLDAKCFGSSTGYAKVKANGGTCNYIYKWSNGATTDRIYSIPAGDYTVTVIDSSGCSKSDRVTIQQPSEINSWSETTPPTCANDSNGKLYISASGGTPYPMANTLSTSLYSNNSTSGIMFDFSVNCSMTIDKLFLSIKDTTDNEVKIWYKENSYSGYEKDSTAWTFLGNYTVSGGGSESGKTYASPVQLKSGLALSTGKYSFFIYDKTGELNCISTNALGSAFVFDHSMTIYSGIGRENNNHSFGAGIIPGRIFSGRISYTINSTNGNAYTYFYDSISSTRNIQSLQSGTVTYSVMDALGCKTTSTSVIPETKPINIQTIQATPPTCHGFTNGVITTTASGGDSNRTVLTGYESDQIANGIMFGITNALPINLKQLKFTISDTSNVTVYIKQEDYSGSEQDSTAWTNLGNYILQPINKKVPVTLTFSNSFQLQTGKWSIYIYNPEGHLQLKSTPDSSNSSFTENNITISQGVSRVDATSAFTTNQGNASFFAGSISFTIPTGGFSYQWSNGSIVNTIDNLTGNNYTITVSDIGGCSNTKVFTLEDPKEISVISNSKNATDDKANGSATIFANGGTAPYYYYWNLLNEAGPTIENVQGGNYIALIADAKGCTAYKTVTVNRTLTPKPLTGILFMLPVPTNNYIHIGKKIDGMENCILRMFDGRGRIIIEKSTSISALMTEGLELGQYDDGLYTISVSDDDQQYSTKISIIR